MFLPLILIRDFGWAGWVVFAVPNVVGAAAMGWVLRAEGRSEALVEAHRPVMQLFSLVTIAFHAAFVMQVLAPVADGLHVAKYVPLLLALACVCAGGRLGVATSILVYAASAGIFANAIAAGVPERALAAMPVPLKSPWEALFMLPVCVFGFLLCPYMDLTFHRARQESGRGAPLAFGLGFGVLFLAMIVGTPLYGELFWGQSSRVDALKLAPYALLVFHVAVQLFFTVGAHVSASGTPTSRGTRASVWSVVGMAIFLAALGAVMFRGSSSPAPLLAESGNDPVIWYRFFMAAYGLLFPAYVLICMIPRRGMKVAKPSVRAILIWLGACCVATPFYWVGFMDRHTTWLVPGVLLVLAARLIPTAQAAPAQPLPSGG